MRDNHLDLDCGRVRVVTLSKFAVHVHDTVVTPLDSGKTTFEVAQGTRKVDIKAMQGKIEIARNKTTSTLLPGQIREIEDEAACRALAAFDWKPIPLWGAGVVPFYFLGGDGDDHQGGGDISPFQP
jgi:ferric-dicitrate binding protein FerR (iron transport regulator)